MNEIPTRTYNDLSLAEQDAIIYKQNAIFTTTKNLTKAKALFLLVLLLKVLVLLYGVSCWKLTDSTYS